MRARLFKFFSSVGAAIILLGGTTISAQTNVSWRAQNIYQIITDRFFNGDPSNDNADGNYDPQGHRSTSVHGGDFKGIEQKLDYIQGLGATAIWISPIVLNVRGEFHGYAGWDFNKVDPHWGTLADLQHLVQAAHARGILVIDDIVVNHGGNLVDSGDAGYPHFKHPPEGYQLRFRDPDRKYPPPFDLNKSHPLLTDLFHNQGFIENYGDPAQAELGELSGLDDFKTESPFIREQMKKIYQDWIAKAGFDGFRVDTVKHVEMGFWEDWCPAIHEFAAKQGKPDFFMFGEVLTHSYSQCASYVGKNGGDAFKLDSTLDYPLYFKIKNVFAKANTNTSELAKHYANVAAHFDETARAQLVTFLDNHDQPRFLSPSQAKGDWQRLKVALVFLYTSPGVPCLYYGTEQGFDGEKDPFDREDMFAGQFKSAPGTDSFDMTHPLCLWVAQLNNFRRLYPALQSGAFSILWSDKQGLGLFAYTRRLGEQELFVAFNASRTNQILPRCPIASPSNTKMVNLLDTAENFTVEAGSRTPPVIIPGNTAKIFIAQSQIRPPDPMVAKVQPAHDGRGISRRAPIVIQFTRPMDIETVQNAFATTPAAHGTFSWSANRDQLTFTPQSEFPASAIVQVRISPQARDANGQPLHAAFESRFQTGEE